MWLHGQNCVVNENCLYKAILKSFSISIILTSGQVAVNSSVSVSVMILFLSQCSTPCHSPIPPAWNKPETK